MPLNASAPPGRDGGVLRGLVAGFAIQQFPAQGFVHQRGTLFLGRFRARQHLCPFRFGTQGIQAGAILVQQITEGKAVLAEQGDGIGHRRGVVAGGGRAFDQQQFAAVGKGCPVAIHRAEGIGAAFEVVVAVALHRVEKTAGVGGVHAIGRGQQQRKQCRGQAGPADGCHRVFLHEGAQTLSAQASGQVSAVCQR